MSHAHHATTTTAARQPLAERRATARTAAHSVPAPTPRRAACTADRCQQGHRACPCPQACHLPDPADATAETPASTAELIGFATWAIGIAAAIVYVLLSAASA
jgi:hypothetical protein